MVGYAIYNAECAGAMVGTKQKTTLYLDRKLLEAAAKAAGTTSMVDTVHAGLRALAAGKPRVLGASGKRYSAAKAVRDELAEGFGTR
jgi:hypothetical protein